MSGRALPPGVCSASSAASLRPSKSTQKSFPHGGSGEGLRPGRGGSCPRGRPEGTHLSLPPHEASARSPLVHRASGWARATLSCEQAFLLLRGRPVRAAPRQPHPRRESQPPHLLHTAQSLGSTGEGVGRPGQHSLGSCQCHPSHPPLAVLSTGPGALLLHQPPAPLHDHLPRRHSAQSRSSQEPLSPPCLMTKAAGPFHLQAPPQPTALHPLAWSCPWLPHPTRGSAVKAQLLTTLVKASAQHTGGS